MADLPDYQRGFFDAMKLVREQMTEFREEHGLLCLVVDELRKRIADAELEATMRFYRREEQTKDGT